MGMNLRPGKEKTAFDTWLHGAKLSWREKVTNGRTNEENKFLKQ